MNHPGATVGFRIQTGDQTIVYITDNEFLKGHLGSPYDVGINDKLVAPFRKIVDFAAGADVLIHEAQYTNEEYLQKIGWGHSSVTNACVLARLAGVKQWLVTHHDPTHDDDFLERKLNLTR